MKVLFLDMDGVMFSFEHLHVAKTNFAVTESCVKQLNRIVKFTGAKIVLSSTWRRFYSLQKMRKLFKDNGCIAKIIDKTPDKPQCISDLRGKGTRGGEIKSWLDAHSEVEKFAVVDDDVFDIVNIITKGVVKTNGYKGLTEEDADKLIEILNEET